MIYIARDKYFTEDFFESVRDIVAKYYNVKECKINGIKYTSGLVTIMFEGQKDEYRRTTKPEWEHRLSKITDNHGFDTGYEEVSRFIKCKLRGKKLEEMGI